LITHEIIFTALYAMAGIWCKQQKISGKLNGCKKRVPSSKSTVFQDISLFHFFSESRVFWAGILYISK